MMTTTARLGLPLLAAGQAQKEITHNEALILLDLLVATVAAAPSNTPPGTPVQGTVHICGPAPVEQWSGQSDKLAFYTEGGWRFFPAFQGMKVLETGSGQDWQFMDGSWVRGKVTASQVVIDGRKVLGAQAPAIAGPVGGNSVDVEARSALAEVLSAMRAHGLIAS